ncbi:VanZ family protein [Robinsoniella peoriensis]|uniref:VanZ family protein n=1 Tax=Robinsoniella peoriensis TaxID=180332 RepID=UPI0005C7BB94|nr:VanZ family protein [Robinsoniella peoriensis]
MNENILKLYEFLTVLTPLLILYIIRNKQYKKKGIAGTKSYFVLHLLFTCYIYAVFYLTGAGTLFDLNMYGIEVRANEVNLLPFSKNIDLSGYLLNILLFVPLGFLMPVIWPKTGKFPYMLLYGFCFSLLIEISQLCNHRRTDVDDLIMNTLGTILGYLLFLFFIKITKWDHKRSDYSRYEPIIYMGVMFLGRFLLFNEFGLVKILYNI